MRKSVYSIIIAGIILTMAQPLKARQAVDIHCHNVFPEFISFLESKGASMEETFPLPHWDVEAHLRFMEEAGIATSVLSMPAPQPYYGNIEECRRQIRMYNDRTAQIKSQYPGKFMFCASLPLPDVNAAIEEAKYALDTLGADGIKLATNSHGQYLGDAELDSLMKVLDERNAVVILHPHRPVPVNEGIISTTPLAIYEYPAETTRAVVNMIANNVPARYPNIKFVIPHCGSFLPLAIPRMKNIHRAMVAKGIMKEVDWEANMKSLYYDLAGTPTPDVIEALLSITTPEHLLYGSDYPYLPAQVLVSGKRLLEDNVAKNQNLLPYMSDIFSGNAERLFSEDKERRQKSEPAICAKLPMSADGIIRLSKVEVDPAYLDEYMKFATEVGEISLRTEPGVLTMYAVQEKENPCNITILETYASQEAYRSHIASAHFQKYKQGTLHMVKNLQLLDQAELNPSNKVVNYINTQNNMAQKIIQTAGRQQLGDFAPEFAHLNDDILFGEVWSRNDLLSLRDRSLVTITSLISQGITDNSLTYHLQEAKKNGITSSEAAEIITHIAFYAGWPKAWAAFNLAKQVWKDDNIE